MTAPRLAITAIAVAIALAGCASTGDSTDQPAPNAERVVAKLTRQVPTVRPGIAYTADSDPNKLLGRPGQYLSKAMFTDTRIPAGPATALGSVDAGGSVEVFGDERGAQARVKYIQGIAAGFPGAVEYDYTAGPVLVRVSKALTPAQADEYQSALRG